HGARLRQIGRAMADKLDIDVAALAGGFTGSVGTSGNPLQFTDLLDAIYELEAANAPKPFVGVLGVGQIADLRNEAANQTVAVFPGNRGIQGSTDELGPAGNGFAGSWFGMDMYFTTNVPTVGGTDHNGMIFSRGYALGMVEKWA